MVEVLRGENPSTVASVLEMQADLQGVLDGLESGGNNPVSSFNSLYQAITQQVFHDLSTADGFQDPNFITTLDIQFAARYFQALRNWTLGAAHAVPRCWSLLFERWDDRHISPELGATLGVNAHVNFDLAHALVGTYVQLPGHEDMGCLQHEDYLKINEIFHDKIPVIAERLSREEYYGHLYDVFQGKFESWVEDELVVGARNLAWQASKRLWRARGNAAATADEEKIINDTASGLADALLSPLGSSVLSHPTRKRGGVKVKIIAGIAVVAMMTTAAIGLRAWMNRRAASSASTGRLRDPQSSGNWNQQTQGASQGRGTPVL